MTIEQDKLEHYVLCATVTFLVALCVLFMSHSLMWGCIVGTAFVLGLSMGKEFGDKRTSGNHWCWWDLLADVLGILTGNSILYACVKLIQACA